MRLYLVVCNFIHEVGSLKPAKISAIHDTEDERQCADCGGNCLLLSIVTALACLGSP